VNPHRAQIESMVPQSGAMCLLDAVTHWDEAQLTCTSRAPEANHPLARDGRVPAVAACEYAAQATAVHGALTEPEPLPSPRSGLLASLVEVNLHETWFPAGGVTVVARLRSRSEGACMYAFEVRADSVRIADGQLMVAFSAPRSA